MAFKYSNEYKLYEKQSALDQRYYQQQQAQLNKWNQESAQKQMDFQKMMSDTAHRRETADLLAAGLNPVLSANNGAATSSGAYANIDSSPLSAASQARIANRQIAKDLTMNRHSLANAYKIARMQSTINAQIQKYAVDRQYQLGLQQAQMSYNASIYGSDRAFEGVNTSSKRSLEGTKYGVDNPATLEGALVRVAQGMLDGAILNNSSGRGGRSKSSTMREQSYQLYNGIKALANGDITALGDFGTGNIGHLPTGVPISSSGLPMTSDQAKRIMLKNNPKSKLSNRTKALYKYGKRLINEYYKYHK